MKLSIVISFFESYKAVSRQVKYFAKMDLPNDIEFIFVDDGSKPSHLIEEYKLKNLTLVHTFDYRQWTQGLARNFGIEFASGKYILTTDIDHILSKEAIMASYRFEGDKMIFPRFFGVLTRSGNLTQKFSTLLNYGLNPESVTPKRGLYCSYHGNTWTMKKSTFMELGMYDPAHCLYGHHAPSRCGEDGHLNHKWNRRAAALGIKPVVGPKIFMFPNGRYNIDKNPNPKGLFHTLSYDQPLIVKKEKK